LGLCVIERIGDHAKNIAGYVLYLVEGVDARHANLKWWRKRCVRRPDSVHDSIQVSDLRLLPGI